LDFGKSRASAASLIVDADTGFGNVINVAHAEHIRYAPPNPAAPSS
jgi:hypothetical protein